MSLNLPEASLCSSACHQCHRSSDLINVPPEYHDLKEVFRKVKATSLPPHRPYDCAIDLLPGTICSLCLHPKERPWSRILMTPWLLASFTRLLLSTPEFSVCRRRTRPEDRADGWKVPK